jgi:hypothetical protein
LDYAVTAQLSVVNMSLGNCGEDMPQGVLEALTDAYNAGIVLVASAGNGIYTSPPCPPDSPVSGIARAPETIAVSAMNQNGTIAYGYQYGPEIDLAAPRNVLTTSDTDINGTMTFGGTSSAAPHVSGAAALLIKAGYSSPSAVRQRLITTAHDRGAWGKDNNFGWGSVDPCAALGLCPVRAFISVAMSGPTVGQPYEWVTVSATASNGDAPLTYEWTVNQSPACGNESNCSVYLGDQGTATDFEVLVTDADLDTGYGNWSVWAECVSPPCDNRPQRSAAMTQRGANASPAVESKGGSVVRRPRRP